MDNITEKLNILAHSVLKDFDFNDISPLNIILDETINSVTVSPANVEVFKLSPIIAGKLKQYKTEEHTTIPKNLLNQNGIVAIHRTLVGYRWATDCVSNPSKFIFNIMHMINVGLVELQSKLGDLSKYSITLSHSTTDDLYFSVNESCAGYEFRISVKHKEV